MGEIQRKSDWESALKRNAQRLWRGTSHLPPTALANGPRRNARPRWSDPPVVLICIDPGHAELLGGTPSGGKSPNPSRPFNIIQLWMATGCSPGLRCERGSNSLAPTMISLVDWITTYAATVVPPKTPGGRNVRPMAHGFPQCLVQTCSSSDQLKAPLKMLANSSMLTCGRIEWQCLPYVSWKQRGPVFTLGVECLADPPWRVHLWFFFTFTCHDALNDEMAGASPSHMAGVSGLLNGFPLPKFRMLRSGGPDHFHLCPTG